MGDAGAVDEDVDGTTDGRERFFYAWFGGDVAGVSGGGCAGLLMDAGEGGVEARWIEIDKGDGRALCGEELGDGEANAAGSSGDNGTFSIQVEHRAGSLRGMSMSCRPECAVARWGVSNEMRFVRALRGEIAADYAGWAALA